MEDNEEKARMMAKKVLCRICANEIGFITIPEDAKLVTAGVYCGGCSDNLLTEQNFDRYKHLISDQADKIRKLEHEISMHSNAEKEMQEYKKRLAEKLELIDPDDPNDW